jgi:fumarate reductase flavoprotein subunit
MQDMSSVAEASERAYDVMVIGGGAAGGAAAIAAAESGARVCLVEAGPEIGGSTALSGGFVMAADTAFLREHGVEDTVDAFYEDVMKVNGGSVDPVAVRRICETAKDTIEWLQTIGVAFFHDPYVRRGHATAGGGEQLMRHVEAELANKGVDVAVQTRVTKLVTDENGTVRGAEIDGEPILVGAVVLTTGGYGANPDMVRDFMPRSRLAGDWIYYVGGAYNRGDGILMAQALNAAVRGEDQGMLGTGNGFRQHTEVYVPSWAMVVNENGVRFGNEFATYWGFPEMLRRQPNHHGFAILDGNMLKNAKADRRIVEYHRQGLTQVSWLPDDFREKIAEGVVKTADGLAELAGKLGMDPQALETSVARYNKFCETGVDEDFAKEAIDLTPILKPPFAAVEVRNLLLWLTHGGLQVNADAQVLNEDNMPISGLYAAGEVVNNINGATYFGTGFSISSALTLGRIAGAAAAAFATASQEA